MEFMLTRTVLAQAGQPTAFMRAPSSRRLEPLRHVDAGVLNIAYYAEGPADGPVAVLLHGFPYDVHSYVDVAPLLAAKGCRAIVPYLRGYGPTQFLDKATPRSGEQAAIGADLMALMDALGIKRAVFAGYDWGGRAACVAAALWPDRCTGLVSVNSYLIRTSQRRWFQRSRSAKSRFGTNIISSLSADGRVLPPIGEGSPRYYGGSGRQIGISTMRASTGRHRPTTIPTTSMW